MDVDRDLLARLETEWSTYEDDDGLNLWPYGGSLSGGKIINVSRLEVWEYVGRDNGDRSTYGRTYTCIAGPFETLEAAQAAYLLLDEPNQKE